ncbi:MAG: N-6 DNA methylase [Enterocloster bolteae]|nr:N-6 DNA methylase [Hungatella sp. L36]MBS6759452.1 N-6 DNA methylase [Hungatella hathewayi]
MKGYLSVYDSACGTGTMLITFAHMLQKKGINPQTNALFVGQDVDRISALTCYIQLAILGLPAYVICRGYLVKFGKNSG